MDEAEQKLLDVAFMAVEKMPKNEEENCRNIWTAFNAGRKWEERINDKNEDTILSVFQGYLKTISYQLMIPWNAGEYFPMNEVMEKIRKLMGDEH